jgi:3-phosphoshikimate 1-carboxyvinyltransferase
MHNCAAGSLIGRVKLPGDKSISHRLLLRAALVKGTCKLENIPHSGDINSTTEALEALGLSFVRNGDTLLCKSPGVNGLLADAGVINCGNSGTTARLLLGLLAGANITATLVGDKSLCTRPMSRVVTPLQEMGANIQIANGNLPAHIQPASLCGINYRLPIASAQLKSALMLAALFAQGNTLIDEPLISRDHTEIILGLNSDSLESSGRRWQLNADKMPQIEWPHIAIPADPSSAAFIVCAALMLPGSRVIFDEILLNPLRIAYVEFLINSGAEIQIDKDPNRESAKGAFLKEDFGRITVKASAHLINQEISAKQIPALIDEIPILAACAMHGKGRFSVCGAEELRYKESDRISSTCRMLRAFGAEVDEFDSGFSFLPPENLQTAKFDADGDHRLAMAAWILALCAPGESEIVGTDCVSVSFPEFHTVLDKLQHS